MVDLVLFHNACVDGFTAAFCAWLKFRDEAEYVPVNFGQPAPDVTGRDVLIVDFSYQRATLLEMRAKAKSLRVFDHHKTAAEDLAGLDFCVFDMDRSGAGITLDELFGSRANRFGPLVSYVEDRDLWRFNLDFSREVNAWIGCVEQTFDNWHDLAREIHDDLASVIGRGTGALSAVDRYVRDMSKQARMLRFDGSDVPVVNAPYINTSELVGHLAEAHPFAVGWFQRADAKYQYSLRSRGDVDVSEIAKRYGGGGHRNAAGFVVAERVTS